MSMEREPTPLRTIGQSTPAENDGAAAPSATGRTSRGTGHFSERALDPAIFIWLMLALLLADAVLLAWRLVDSSLLTAVTGASLRWVLVFTLIGASLVVSAFAIARLIRGTRTAEPLPVLTRQGRKHLLKQLHDNNPPQSADDPRVRRLAENLVNQKRILLQAFGGVLILTSQAISPSPSDPLVYGLFETAIAVSALGLLIASRNIVRGRRYLMKHPKPPTA
ncbi:hypothetical protein [Pengzhenrongella sp.]|uniref:hypothetical protein n=1 Tax=Pengzhenrongella sp. TaxID=2888820 RepID=UPI002F91E505